MYGEVRRGHGLRAASGDNKLASELTSRLDLPDTAPPGADWSPYVSGFPYRDRYVIARTFRDPNATRTGMVLSHVLIASLDEIINISDLQEVFDQLITQPVAPAHLLAFSIDFHDKPVPSVPELAATASALVTRAAGPVVRVGHEGFEQLIASLWARLWPTMRREFSFRISFGPGDLIESLVPVLVCTPSSLAARWQGHRLIHNYTNASSSLASRFLIGDVEGEQLRLFADSIGTEFSNFGDLTLLEQAYRFAILVPAPIGNSVAAIRLVERLSPDPQRGKAGKEKILESFIFLLKSATASDILSLRNLQLNGFAQAEKLWRALNEWVAKNLFPKTQDLEFLTAVTDALRIGKACEDWCHAILGGLRSATREGGEFLPSALWRWAEADPTITEPLWECIEVDKLFESSLVRVAPLALKHGQVRPILSYAAHNGLYRLHGAAAVAAESLLDALRLQVSIEPASENEGIQVILQRATSSEVLSCAIDIGDVRLISFATNAVSEEPELLTHIDVSNKVVREIWSSALVQNLSVWEGPANPRAAFDQILSEYLDGFETSSLLIDRLANTPLGDLSAFPRRAELWAKLSGNTRSVLLRATASGWIESADKGYQSAVELPLCDSIRADHKFDVLLDRLAFGQIARAAMLVGLLPSFEEVSFRRWLRKATLQTLLLNTQDAEAIGRLVDKRHWKNAADDLMQLLRSGRTDMRPALRACLSLIGFFDRWMYGLSDLTAIEKWDLLIKLAADLYPLGPDEDGLWERAGGHNSDLGYSGSGRSRWRDAIGRVRLGRTPRIDNLLREMLQDYKDNADLNFLAADKLFGGHR
ncbi:effector-associated domain EAD1-containing protein [Pseudomonas sp. P105]|uniref:GAP1-N1 domain-containing protein n=1 Tax=Pseudomonas sp. P105 TaxID=3049542 RepID=UPI0029343AB1|nr:effector-associated domain EAD1-containing protein [Pseudomonas sp. P105]WNZ79318.1 effector-associated domain EAD1-containing protein [Pseudomonas sp. P105]